MTPQQREELIGKAWRAMAHREGHRPRLPPSMSVKPEPPAPKPKPQKPKKQQTKQEITAKVARIPEVLKDGPKTAKQIQDIIGHISRHAWEYHMRHYEERGEVYLSGSGASSVYHLPHHKVTYSDLWPDGVRERRLAILAMLETGPKTKSEIMREVDVTYAILGADLKTFGKLGLIATHKRNRKEWLYWLKDTA